MLRRKHNQEYRLCQFFLLRCEHMNLLQQLSDDLKAAMKGRDLRTLEVLRMAVSSIKTKAIDLGRELSDAEVLDVIRADAKKMKDAMSMFVSGAREDLATAAKEEIAVLKRYLPAEMSDEELEEKVRAKIAELGATDPSASGKVVGALMKELAGQADGGRVKAAVERVLTPGA